MSDDLNENLAAHPTPTVDEAHEMVRTDVGAYCSCGSWAVAGGLLPNRAGDQKAREGFLRHQLDAARAVPAPPVTVTDDMVERACIAWAQAGGVTYSTVGEPFKDSWRRSARAALTAALTEGGAE